jgi:predicted  nucleic acid-binding Zn-ribbon protein
MEGGDEAVMNQRARLLLPGCPECGWNDVHAPLCSRHGQPAPPATVEMEVAVACALLFMAVIATLIED